MPPPDDLHVPTLTQEQMEAAERLTAAVGLASVEYDPTWRAILGAKMDELLLLCHDLKTTVLAFRTAWYSVNEKTLNPDRLKFLDGIVRSSDLNYARTAAYGERDGGGVSAASSAESDAHLVEPPSRKLQALGKESWSQFWKGRVNKGRGLYFSSDAIRATGVKGLSPPQLPVLKMDVMGRAREGVHRIVSNHSKKGASNSTSSKFHQPRPVMPTPEQISRMSIRNAFLYPGVDQKGNKHDVEAAYNIVDVTADDVRLFGAQLPDELAGGEPWQAFQITYDFGFVGSAGIYFGAVALGINASHNSHEPIHPHLNGPFPFTLWTHGDDTMATETDLHHRISLSDTCARTGIYIVAGPNAIGDDKLKEEGTPRAMVSGIGLTRHLNDETVEICEPRIRKTQDRWNNPAFDYGCREILLLALQKAVGPLRRAAQVRRLVHAAYSSMNRFLTSSDERKHIACPRGTPEEVEWLYHLFWKWTEVIRLDLAHPEIWHASVMANTTNALSLRERLAIPGFSDSVFILAGDSNERVLFTLDVQLKKCSFVFWTCGLEKAIISSLAASGMPVDEHSSMMISFKEMAGPTLAADLWGKHHHGSTAFAINDNQNACVWIQTLVSRNPIAQHFIMILTRAESRDSADYFSAYVNTHRNQLPDAGTRVLDVESGTDAAAQAETYFAWAKEKLPGYEIEDWTETAGDLLGRVCNFGSLMLSEELRRPAIAPARPQAGASQQRAPPSDGDGIFEHCDATRAMTSAFVEAGYASLGGSEIDRHALQYQVDIFGDTGARSVDLLSDPIRRLTRAQKRSLKVMLGEYPCNPFCTVSPFRKGHEDPSAWPAYETLKILDDPDVNPDMMITENVTSWANDPKVPDACRRLGAKHGYSMQVIRILTSHFGTPNVRRRILVVWEPKAWTQDLGEITSPSPTHKPVAVVGYLDPVGEVPFGLWAEGVVIPYDGPQYHSSYLPRRAGYLIRGASRVVVWSIYHPC